MTTRAPLRGGPWRRALPGMRDTLPFLPGVVVLGVVFGASAGGAGIAPLTAAVMSFAVFSGSGQFAALPLWTGSLAVLGLTAVALSLRFALMSASLAPRLSRMPVWRQAVLAFSVTDENYALAVSRTGGRTEEVDPVYLAASGALLYVAWGGGTVAGLVLGAQVPTAWEAPLGAVFPVVFVTLTVLCCTSRTAVLVAALAALLSAAGAGRLPAGSHVVLAAVLASLAGALLAGRRPGGTPQEGR